MPLSDEDRAALRAFWLSEPLPEHLAEALAAWPAEARERQAAFQRQQELREYLRGLGLTLARQTRRLILSYSPAAAARLVELMRGENLETSRKAAVDLLRLHETSVKNELAEAADESALEGRALADNLSEDQYRQLLALLADAGAGARAACDLTDLPARSVHTGSEPGPHWAGEAGLPGTGTDD